MSSTTLDKKKNAVIVPCFAEGDTLNTPPNLYNETTGKVTEVRRLYSECDEHGNIIRGGLDALECQFYIPEDKSLHDKPWVSKGNKDITYEFAGPNMIVGRWAEGKCPQVCKPVFYNICTRHSYTLSTDRMNTIYSEKSLLKLNKKTR